MSVQSLPRELARWILFFVAPSTAALAEAASPTAPRKILVEKATTIRTESGLILRYEPLPAGSAPKHHSSATPFRCVDDCPPFRSLLPEIQRATKTDAGLGATLLLD